MITIIILSRYDSNYLKRALTYYKTLNFKGRIFVADSSTLEDKIKIRAVVKEFQSDLFYPMLFDYGHEVGFAEKIADVIQKVCTPYVLFAPGDDFFSLEAIRESMEFLRMNPDYSFVMGYRYGYTYHEDGLLDWYYTGDYDHSKSISHDDPLERINSYLDRYIATFYSVFRTEILTSVLQKSVLYANDPCTKFFENMITMVALLYGKEKYLSIPFSWREQKKSSLGSIYNDKWLLDENFEKYEQLMEKGIKKSLEDIIYLDSVHAGTKSKQIVQKFIESCFNSLYPIQQKSGFKQSIKQYVPVYIWNSLKFFKNKKIVTSRTQWSGEHLLYDTKSPFYREFELVKKLILDSKMYAYKSGLDDIKILQRADRS